MPNKETDMEGETQASEDNLNAAAGLSEGLGCAICGGKMVYVRGRHPGMDRRLTCPTCTLEMLEDIKTRLRSDYGVPMQEAT